MNRERDDFEKFFEPFMHALERKMDWGKAAHIGVECSIRLMKVRGKLEFTADEMAEQCPYEVEPFERNLSVAAED
ncbi:hypothetical protein HYU95_05220 [Candidatus Daviesbacteria bacterium]|nr:hypothetical protein [Candidatus Daviesbacteria bacterium]